MGTRVTAIEVPTPAVAAPTFSPAGGNYNAQRTVTISTAPAGVTTPVYTGWHNAQREQRDSGHLGRDRQLKDAQGCSSPGLLRREATGRTMAVVVQPGMPATILISNAAFALADDKGLGPGVKQFPVPSATVVSTASASATAQPVVTVQVTGRK